MKNIISIIVKLTVLFGIQAFACASTVDEYLILEDIASYKRVTEVADLLTEKIKSIPGYEIREFSGIIIATGHFDLDHADITYSTDYESDIADLGVDVQVTQHAGAESDKWLLHEVERGFRRGEYEENMTSSRFRNIDGNNIFYSGLGGGTYRWVSNAVMVNIQYTDLYKEKPEPLEVVKAYLAKHPSTIPDMSIDDAHNETWIKDEMERRLWLCDKWFMQLQMEKAETKDVLRESVKHMEEFLDYREKYYGVSREEEKDLLRGYLSQQNGTEIKNRLENLKQWWTENKGNAINL